MVQGRLFFLCGLFFFRQDSHSPMGPFKCPWKPSFHVPVSLTLSLNMYTSTSRPCSRPSAGVSCAFSIDSTETKNRGSSGTQCSPFSPSASLRDHCPSSVLFADTTGSQRSLPDRIYTGSRTATAGPKLVSAIPCPRPPPTLAHPFQFPKFL